VISSSDNNLASRPQQQRQQPPGFLRRHGVKLIASVAITALIVIGIHKGGLKFFPEGGDFASVQWWTLPAYGLSYMAMTWFRSVRWRFLLNSIAVVPKKRLLKVSLIGFAAILLLPWRLGEIVRPYMVRTPANKRGERGDIASESRRPITLTAAASSVVAERIIDGLYVSIVLAVALVFVPTVHPLPDHVVGLPISVAQVRRAGYAMLALFGTAFTTIAVFYFARSWAHRMTFAVVGKVSQRLAEKLSGLFEKFADGLHAFGRRDDALGFLFETTCYWFLNIGGMWLLAWGCGVVHADGTAPTFGEACALMGMLGCAVLIPCPPGMLGVFQAGIYAAMTMYYPTSIVTGPGAAYVFLLYASQLVLTTLMGAAALGLERGGLKKLEEAESLAGDAA
jgi:hypothetical protein